jgi:hypothetical protein
MPEDRIPLAAFVMLALIALVFAALAAVGVGA